MIIPPKRSRACTGQTTARCGCVHFAVPAPADRIASARPLRESHRGHYAIKERRSAVATACVRFLAWSFAIALRT